MKRPFKLTEPTPFSKAFTLECPECGEQHERRRDTFLLGLHQATCVVCGHSTNRVQDGTGKIHEAGSEARQGGGA